MIDKIYNEDCLIGMQRIPDGSVDFVLTDLPFEITACDFDVKIDLTRFWEEINRVTKRSAAIALFANGKFLIELAASNLKEYRYKWVWQKSLATGFLNAKKMPLKAHEDILVFYRKLPTYNPQFITGKPYQRKCFTGSDNYQQFKGGLKIWKDTENEGWRYPVDVQKFKIPFSGGVGDKTHPTQKPVDLLEYLIKTYTNEGELVLDATIGSGSTAVAAINTGRHFIGFETEKKFYDIANERIAKAQAEVAQRLF